MQLRALIVFFCAMLAAPVALADDRLVRLYAPQALVNTGVFDYVLPRFSLKTQVRVTLTDSATEADMVLGAEGRPVFAGLGQNWAALLPDADHAAGARLSDWLASDVGQRTVASFAPDDEPLFGPPEAVAQAIATLDLDGDPVTGRAVSRAKCTRCHAVDDQTSWSSIGSTPSFAVLRSLPDWQDRFVAFYALAPHPAFMVVQDVTPPFPEDRPPPIVPVAMTLDELDHLMAYVAEMAPADLGAPLKHQ
jgi:mono/diheme cytochrome c family protein